MYMYVIHVQQQQWQVHNVKNLGYTEKADTKLTLVKISGDFTKYWKRVF